MLFPEFITVPFTQGLSDHAVCSFISLVSSLFLFDSVLCISVRILGELFFHFALTVFFLQALFIHGAPPAFPCLHSVSQRLILLQPASEIEVMVERKCFPRDQVHCLDSIPIIISRSLD